MTMTMFGFAKEKEQLDKVKDADFIAAWRIYNIAEWLLVIGCGALIMGAFLLFTSRGTLPAWMVLVGGVSAVIASRLVRGLGALVENSAYTRRYNSQMLAELRRMQSPADGQQPQAEDVKYKM